MRKVQFIFIVIFSFSFASSQASDETIDCVDGKIKTIENKKEVIVYERYCFDTVLKSISSTKKCPDGCLVDNLNPLVLKHSELKSITESPLFIICRKAQGVPQQIDYWANHRWISTSRCLFSDGTYQDINRLISSRVKYED